MNWPAGDVGLAVRAGRIQPEAMSVADGTMAMASLRVRKSIRGAR